MNNPHIVFKDGKILFVENWPTMPVKSFDAAHYVSAAQEYQNALDEYNEACVAVLSGALEVENPTLIQGISYSAEGNICQGIMQLNDGDPFPLPGNVGWEVVDGKVKLSLK
jgi:hypothetical protein